MGSMLCQWISKVTLRTIVAAVSGVRGEELVERGQEVRAEGKAGPWGRGAMCHVHARRALSVLVAARWSRDGGQAGSCGGPDWHKTDVGRCEDAVLRQGAQLAGRVFFASRRRGADADAAAARCEERGTLGLRLDAPPHRVGPKARLQPVSLSAC